MWISGQSRYIVRNLYPNLTASGHIFIDEVVGTDYCAIFYRNAGGTKTHRTPPGLIGAGIGLALASTTLGHGVTRRSSAPACQCRRVHAAHMSGYWSYYPKDPQEISAAPGLSRESVS